MTVALLALGFLSGLLGGDGSGGCAQSSATAERTMRVIEQQWPLRASTDPVSRYAQSLGTRLSRSLRVPADPDFLVARNLEPMAFALGGERFVISDGLVALVRDESQLAAVLAHELSHQYLGHFCSSSGGAEKIPMGGIIQHLDLRLEMEADRSAVDILYSAGFDPGAMASVLRCLQQSGYGGSQLTGRIQALDYGAPTGAASSPVSGADSAAFRKTRRLLDQEIGGFDSLPTRCQ